jgi:hypothetical protein
MSLSPRPRVSLQVWIGIGVAIGCGVLGVALCSGLLWVLGSL